MNRTDVKRASSRIANRLAPLIKGWLGWTIFAITAYVGGMYLTIGIILVLSHLGLFVGIDATNYALLTRILMYVVLATLMIMLPAWLRQRPSRREIGVERLMQWKDIGIGIAGLILYLLFAMGALAILKLIPGVDGSQAQQLDVGSVYGFSRMIVFVVLVIVTPFMEELLFRGLLYGGLRARRLPVWASALIVSVLFGIAHGQLNVGVDVFCLSIVACYARELTGSIWAGVVLHMIKNFIAFAIVFLVNQG